MSLTERDVRWAECTVMSVKLIAKDDFRLPAVAPWMVRGEGTRGDHRGMS
jgi:hypothetical protein